MKSTDIRSKDRRGRQDVRYSDKSLPSQMYAGPNAAQRRGGASIGGALLSVFDAIGSTIGRAASFLWSKSKALSALIILVAVLAIGFGVDNLLTANKIYQGVSVGSVDLSNKTVDEAREAISNQYSDKLFATQTFVFKDEEALDAVILDRNNIDIDTLTNLVSSEENQDSHTIWLADAITLGAELPADSLAEQAFEVGRGSGFFDRIGALAMGYNIKPYASYNNILLDNMIESIEEATGNKLLNWGVAINEGVASVTEGHDGYELDKETFVDGLNNLFFEASGDYHTYSADVPFVEVKIDQAEAQNTCDAINATIGSGASFSYEGRDVDIDAATLGSWVTTKIEQTNNGFRLNPIIDEDSATTPLVELLNAGSAEYDVSVSIYEEDSQYIVKPSEAVIIPSASNAIENLDDALFSTYRNTGNSEIEGSQFGINVSSENYDGTFPVQDALAYGVVDAFSSYTTEYSTKASNANRIYNIHLVSDLLNNSIVDAYGGKWSFNEIVGDTTEEAGFREAGSIIEGERTDAIGGGVCQVATTVFNAVYNSGLPIAERHNHSLYMSAYPDGRDAAVSYPLLDFIWENDTTSDILVTTSYTDNSVTVNLIGVNPKLSVETEIGEWQEGEAYPTKIEVDESLADDAIVVETNGADGQIIEVKRTVKDASGAIVREKTFVSVYTPVTQIIKVGTAVDTQAVYEKYKRKDPNDKSSSSKSSESSSSSGSSSSSSSNSSGSSGSSKSSNTSNSSSSSTNTSSKSSSGSSEGSSSKSSSDSAESSSG